jgi:hypothetical protein
MTTQYNVQNYGPNGLISTQTVTLTGEPELAYLGPDKLRQAYTTLRQWSADAETESTAWATQSQAQRDAAMATTFHRLSIFFDRFADLLLLEGRT